MELHSVTFTPMRMAAWITRFTTMLVLALSAVIGGSMLAGITEINRSVVGAAGPHLSTVIMTVGLASGLLLVSPVRPLGRSAQLLFALATAFAVAGIVGIVLVLPGFPVLGRWVQPGMRAAWQAAYPVDTGLNALVTGMLVGLAQLLRPRVPRLAMAVGLAAPVMPVVALFGYSYGFEHFQGEMSPMTTLFLLPLALAGLLTFVRRPILRPLFSDTMLGRLARLQIAGGLVFPWALGAVLVLLLDEDGSRAAIQSALMALFTVAVVVAATQAHAATDGRRRRSVRALQRASVTDQLTGLHNRHGAVDRLAALPADEPCGVIVADLDNFKLVNDTWGHAEGDQVLVKVAAAVKGALTGEGFVARWGGEEFLVVLPGADLAQTKAVADRLRASLCAIPGPNGLRGEITGSFGVSLRAENEPSLEATIQRADSALYHAKDAGRDRVVSKIREPVVGTSTQPLGDGRRAGADAA